MKILFATIAFPESLDQRNIYTDLMEEFRDRGHQVYVVASSERRLGKGTNLKEDKGIQILRVRTWNVKKTRNPIEKGLGTLFIGSQYESAIQKFWGTTQFDLVLYSTPPITLDGLIHFVKKRDGAKSYLLLKDIFPQNAVDIGMVTPKGLLHRYFSAREKRLYSFSDFIGCMSRANMSYLRKHHPEISEEKVEVCPNSIRPGVFKFSTEARIAIREKYGIPKESVVFIYGGNLGKPQGVGFIEEVLESNRNRLGIFFLIVGSGTEYRKIEQAIAGKGIENAKLLSYLPKEDYDHLLAASDVGLIFLDPRFTIPNFPSRLLAYLDHGKPVLAATDVNTDLGQVITDGDFGFWCESGDLESFNAALARLVSSRELREKMGKNGRKYLLAHYTVDKACETILGHFE